MQKLSITKRPAQLKGSIASRPEIHGDAIRAALTLSVGGILLFAKDLIAMYNDEDAHNRLFTGKGGAGLVPAFPGTILLLTEIFKGAKVTLQTVDMTKALILKPATIKDIALVAQDAGGHVLMACKILGAPPEDDGVDVNPLHMLNKKCTIAILNGALASKDERQKELALDEGGPGTGPEVSVDEGGTVRNESLTEAEREEAQATSSAIGRQIERSERKTAAKKKRASKPH